jgi:hypothetical protein
VHGVIWRAQPWRETVTTIASGLIPLSDGVQDYSPPPQIYRLLRAAILRTDTTPDQSRELDVMDQLAVDLTPKSYTGIQAIALQRAVGQLRLDTAVSVPTGITLEIAGEFQLHPSKVTALTQKPFFDDKYMNVFIEGLLYWLYKKQDDPTREQTQYAVFKAALEQMAKDEDFGGTDLYFPGETMGLGYDSGSGVISVFGY